jgi:hypothetical protein
MSLITERIQYDVAGGNKNCPAAQCEDRSAMIQVLYAITGSVYCDLEQSSNGQDWDPVPGSTIQLDADSGSHTYNIPGTKRGMFLRVVIRPQAGSTGTINLVNYLV